MKIKLFIFTLLFAACVGKMKSQSKCITYDCFLCDWGGEFKIVAPTIFTPNGDFINDVWEPIVSNDFCLDKYNVRIFNRWGTQVFESFVSDMGWDGFVPLSKEVYPEGTYYYVMTFSNKNTGEMRSAKGFFQLAR